jgi:hypothetical protein
MRSDHEITRLKRQMRQNRTAVGIALGQSTARTPIDDRVISPDQLDTKIKPSVVDASSITVEKGIDYSKNPPDVWLKIYWNALLGENVTKYQIGLAPAGTSDWEFGAVYVGNSQLGSGFSLGASELGVIQYTFHNLQPGKQYKCMIQVQNSAGAISNWTEVLQDSRFLTGADTQPPATPTVAPTVTGAVTKMIVEFDWCPEADYDITEVHMSTTPDFTPNTSTLAWSGRGDMCVLNGAAGTTYFVKYRYKDTSGNFSGYSPQGSATCGFVANTSLADAAITTAKIANLAIDNSKLADLAVDAAKLANSSVTSTKIANAAVGSAAIANAAIGTAHIATAAITTALINDGAITNAKIGTAAVDSAKIADAAIGNAKIANLAVTDAKIDTVSVSKLTAGTITSKIITLTGTANNAQIKSSDYDYMLSGWAIKGDGSAEFNDVIIRGTLNGCDGVFSGELAAGDIKLTGGDSYGSTSLNMSSDNNEYDFIQLRTYGDDSLYVGHSTSPGGTLANLDRLKVYADLLDCDGDILTGGDYVMSSMNSQKLQCSYGTQNGAGIGWWDDDVYLGKTYFG